MRWLALPLVVQMLACSGVGDTSIQLRFVVDPELNSERQVLDGIDTLQLVLFAQGGFSGVTVAGELFGPLRAADVDMDGVIDLVLDREVQGAFPWLRLLPGHNLDRRFQLSARGLNSDSITAIGKPQSMGFVAGEHQDLVVPLNLLARYRPPRVDLTLPRDGDSTASPDKIYVRFSKEVKAPGSALRLLDQVPGSWSCSTVTVRELGIDEVHTECSLELGACALGPGQKRLEATAEIRDLDGRQLHQDAGAPAPSPYAATFTIAGSCTCATDADCGTGYTCDTTSGRCRLATTLCGGKTCPPGYICSSSGTCVGDCRVVGSVVCDTGSVCDTATGRCDPTAGLVAPSRLDEISPGVTGPIVRDSSGHGHDGVLVKGPVLTAGVLAKALSFDGADDYIFLGDSGLAEQDYRAFTLSVWYRSADGTVGGTTGPHEFIFLQCTTGVPGGSWPWLDLDLADLAGHEGQPRLKVKRSWFDPIVGIVYGSTNVVDQTWHHIAAVRTDDTPARLQIYVDGTLEADVVDQNGGGLLDNATGQPNEIYIGGMAHWGESYLHGSLDDFRIYDRALTATEIRALHDLAGSTP